MEANTINELNDFVERAKKLKDAMSVQGLKELTDKLESEGISENQRVELNKKKSELEKTMADFDKKMQSVGSDLSKHMQSAADIFKNIVK